MTAQQTEAPQTLLRDGRTVLIRALDEGDYAALLTFGAALPQDDLLYLENDFQNPDIIRRLVNAAAAENWRQVVALAGGAAGWAPRWHRRSSTPRVIWASAR